MNDDLEHVAQRVVKQLTDVVESLEWVEPTRSQLFHAAALVASIQEMLAAAANNDAAALHAASERARALAVVPL